MDKGKTAHDIIVAIPASLTTLCGVRSESTLLILVHSISLLRLKLVMNRNDSDWPLCSRTWDIPVSHGHSVPGQC